MPRSAVRILQVFVSSPGDVKEERAAVVHAVEALRHDPLVAARFVPRAVGWDLPGVAVALTATASPQPQINQGVPRPGDCDVAVFVFGGRMGTPLSVGGVTYRSGTESEYQDAVRGWRRRGRPVILVYRRDPLPPVPEGAPDREEQLAQRRRLDEFFRENFHEPDGSFKGSYGEYDDPRTLAARIQTDLRSAIARLEQPGRWQRVLLIAAPIAAVLIAGIVYSQWPDRPRSFRIEPGRRIETPPEFEEEMSSERETPRTEDASPEETAL